MLDCEEQDQDEVEGHLTSPPMTLLHQSLLLTTTFSPSSSSNFTPNRFRIIAYTALPFSSSACTNPGCCSQSAGATLVRSTRL